MRPSNPLGERRWVHDNQTEEAQEAEEPVTSGGLRVSDPRHITFEKVLEIAHRIGQSHS